jgi:hypothetical protein
MRRAFVSLIVAMSAAVVALAATSPHTRAAERASILIVGTYHMSNPGNDLHNVEAADVLTPARQQEIAAVTAALGRFAPNRVAVEWPADVANERYAQYVAGTLPESRNEVVQLGFRLARERELSRVHGLDVPGEFPFDAVQAFAAAHERSAEIERLMAGGAAEVARLTQMQNETSVGGVLRYLNEPASIARNHAFYPPLLTMGERDDQPGVALVAAWYERNLAICARLLQVVEPGDRVVAFYGQGHVYLLRQCLVETQAIDVVDPLAYLPNAAI